MRCELLLMSCLVACSGGGKSGDSAVSGAGDGGADGADGADGTDGADGVDGGDDGADGGDLVDADGDGFAEDVDCDDTNADVFPGATEVAGDGLDNDCDPATCEGAGFGPAQELSLPGGYADRTFESMGLPGDCPAMRPVWSTTDIDGDGVQDAVIAGSACGGEEPGQTEWWVHPGGAEGFAETAVSWALPSDRPAGNFAAVNGRPADCDLGMSKWFLRDMDGDGRGDIVVPSECGASDVGRTHWLVYTNTGTGFAATPTNFPLPTGYPDGTFASPSNPGNCDTGVPAWGMGDLMGRGKADIVVRRSACADDAVGASEWRIHENTGTAFVDAASVWALPSGYGVGTFHRGDHGGDCPSGVPAWESKDIDGDGIVDAVMTWLSCEEEVVGTTRWDVHLGSAAGFAATATPWTLPEGYGPRAFTAVAAERACDVSRPRYQLLDLTGDGQGELVVFVDPCGDSDVGTARWRVHAADGTGFATTSTDVGLPAGYGPVTFGWPGAVRSCGDETPGWNLFDITADGQPDVLVTASACLDDEVGRAVWKVHPGGCDL